VIFAELDAGMSMISCAGTRKKKAVLGTVASLLRSYLIIIMIIPSTMKMDLPGVAAFARHLIQHAPIKLGLKNCGRYPAKL